MTSLLIYNMFHSISSKKKWWGIFTKNIKETRPPHTHTYLVLSHKKNNIFVASPKLTCHISYINSCIYRITLLTIFINLLNDLSEGRRLHLHPHHGEDSSHLGKRNCRNILYMMYQSYHILYRIDVLRYHFGFPIWEYQKFCPLHKKNVLFGPKTSKFGPKLAYQGKMGKLKS